MLNTVFAPETAFVPDWKLVGLSLGGCCGWKIFWADPDTMLANRRIEFGLAGVCFNSVKALTVSATLIPLTKIKTCLSILYSINQKHI